MEAQAQLELFHPPIATQGLYEWQAAGALHSSQWQASGHPQNGLCNYPAVGNPGSLRPPSDVNCTTSI